MTWTPYSDSKTSNSGSDPVRSTHSRAHLRPSSRDLCHGDVNTPKERHAQRDDRHGRSGHANLCPVLALVARTIALREAAAPPNTPLNAYRIVDQPLRFVLPVEVTRYLRAALALYPASAIPVRSACAGGAMALLCAGIDSDRIRLIERWRSDELYRYLHVQAQEPVMTGISATMLRGGSFRLAPG